MKKNILVLLVSLTFFSCDFINDFYSDKVIEDLRKQGGIIETKEDTERRKKLTGNLRPQTLTDYPDTLNELVDEYIKENYNQSVDDYSFEVYFPVTTSAVTDLHGKRSKDTAYIDTSVFTVDLRVVVLQDTDYYNVIYQRNFELFYDIKR